MKDIAKVAICCSCDCCFRYLVNECLQVELLDSALKRNTVVCMGSSTGRTFIAVMLIKEMAEDVRKSLSEGGKRSVYLVDSGRIS